MNILYAFLLNKYLEFIGISGDCICLHSSLADIVKQLPKVTVQIIPPILELCESSSYSTSSPTFAIINFIVKPFW